MQLAAGLFAHESCSNRQRTIGSKGSNTTGSSENSSTTALDEEITHFAILVPGTGPQREDEKPKGTFMKKAKKFRKMLRETCSREFADIHACVEMEPIEFHSDLHALDSAKGRMDAVTLPSIPWIRTLDNEILGDILYYFSSFHGHRMLGMVITKLNAAYQSFMERHPRFSGQVDLIAHSLGGIICYEILYLMDQRKRQKENASNRRKVIGGAWESARYEGLPDLEFVPNRLFTMGSPLGGAMVFRNLSFGEYLMGGVGYHNIFHPYDPLGYRTEPLVDDSYVDTPAMPITGGPNMHSALDDDGAAEGAEEGSSSAARGMGARRRLKRNRTLGRQANGGQRASLGGYVTGVGRTMVDAMVIGPLTISSTVLHAAKSTVAVPVNAMARRMSSSGGVGPTVDDEGSRESHSRKLRHRMSMLLGVSSAKNDDHAQRMPSDVVSSNKKSFSWIVSSSRSQSLSFDVGSSSSKQNVERTHGRRGSLSRLLHRSWFGGNENSSSSNKLFGPEQLRPLEAHNGGQASDDASSTQISTEEKEKAKHTSLHQQQRNHSNAISFPGSLEDADDSNGNSSSSSSNSENLLSYLCSPHVAAAVSAMATTDPAQRQGKPTDKGAEKSEDEAAVETLPVQISDEGSTRRIDRRRSAKSLSPQLDILDRYTMATEKDEQKQPAQRDTRQPTYDNAVDTDDLVGHIMRIFSLSRPPDKRQQLAEAQGLPLSSRLLSSSRNYRRLQNHSAGVPISASRTVPHTSTDMQAPPLSALDKGSNSDNNRMRKRKPTIENNHRSSASKRITVTTTMDIGFPIDGIEREETDAASSCLQAGLRRANTLPLALADGRHRLRASSSSSGLRAHGRAAPTESTEAQAHGDETKDEPPIHVLSPMPANDDADSGSNESSHQNDDDDSQEDLDKNNSPSLSSSRHDEGIHLGAVDGDKQKGLPYPERMDYIIPFTKRHLQNEYWLGFHSHFSYWTSKEVVYHILYHMVCKPMDQQQQQIKE
ncbi:hypothetical protein IWW48_006157 [Coemansia sp. RSA 1200]|nr:hypothetical protein IWW48_006157 [Coemansia sp. RSA 1200]